MQYSKDDEEPKRGLETLRQLRLRFVACLPAHVIIWQPRGFIPNVPSFASWYLRISLTETVGIVIPFNSYKASFFCFILFCICNERLFCMIISLLKNKSIDMTKPPQRWLCCLFFVHVFVVSRSARASQDPTKI